MRISKVLQVDELEFLLIFLLDMAHDQKYFLSIADENLGISWCCNFMLGLSQVFKNFISSTVKDSEHRNTLGEINLRVVRNKHWQWNEKE